MSFLQWGAFGFGAVIGWFTYHVNRYRGEVKLTDVLTLIGAVGGGAILALFPQQSDSFAAYGLGLAFGFFGYFAVLLVLVARSPRFTTDWFLDGRRPSIEPTTTVDGGGPAVEGTEIEDGGGTHVERDASLDASPASKTGGPPVGGQQATAETIPSDSQRPMRRRQPPSTSDRLPGGTSD
jgi:hypothetical protein